MKIEELGELMVLIMITVIGIVIFLLIGLGGKYLINKHTCNLLHRDMHIETKYELWNGCYVKVNNRFIPRENWRGEYQQ